MRWEPTFYEGEPKGEPLTLRFYPEDSVPLLTAEEAERAGAVFLQRDDGTWVESDTVIDPESGSVFVVPKD